MLPIRWLMFAALALFLAGCGTGPASANATFVSVHELATNAAAHNNQRVSTSGYPVVKVHSASGTSGQLYELEYDQGNAFDFTMPCQRPDVVNATVTTSVSLTGTFNASTKTLTVEC